MYQALLTRRYLTSKVMPLLSALAVMLCTAMVLVVWSVMGGFLATILASGKTIIGDVAIDVPLPRGIPYYLELVDRLEADPAVAAASPLIETMGLAAFNAEQRRMVGVMGVEPDSFHAVTGFFDWQHWKQLESPTGGKPSIDLRADPVWRDPMAIAEDAGRTLEEISPVTGVRVPAAVPGIEVSRANQRFPGNIYEPTWMIGFMEELTLSVLPLSQKGSVIDLESRQLPIANEFRTGLYETDANTIIVPLGVLQEMMNLQAGQRVIPSFEFSQIERDPVTGEERFVPLEYAEPIPARVTAIYLRAAPGVTPRELDKVAERIYLEHHEAHPDDVFISADGTGPEARWREMLVYTWEEKPGLKTFIAAVKKETGLVLILFSFISLTAVFLVLAIFWSMISEKTRDIGILRAVGASRAGVSWLFIRYGLAIGVVGAVAGVALAHVVVWNINTIHDLLGKLNIVIWDPATYYFAEIPNDVDPLHALYVLIIGILAAALGAVVPALRAGSYDPVKALRFE